MPTQPQQKVLRERPEPLGEIPLLYLAFAVRSFCLQCVETETDVRDCSATCCQLWPYRFGRGYLAALRKGLVVDPNTPEAYALRDQYR